MSVAPSSVFAYLKQEHGVSTASAAGILANIKAESGFDPGAHNPDDPGYGSVGLFQWHSGRRDGMMSYAEGTGREWTNWQAQVDYAIKEAKGMGIDLQSNDPVAASKEWTLRFERPANKQQKAVDRAKNVGKYMDFDPDAEYDPEGGSVAEPGSGNATVDSEDQEVMNIPPDGTWYRHPDGGYAVAYAVQADEEYGSSSKSVVWFRSDSPPPSGESAGSAKWFSEKSAGWVDGGTTDTFRGVPKGKTWAEMVQETLFKLGLSGSDAVYDSGVMAVVGIAMTREVSETELTNRLQKTQWYQDRTNKEREWDNLSEAEKEQRTVDEAMRLSSSWFTYVGEDLQVANYDQNGDGHISSDELRQGNSDLFTWAQKVASGKATQATAVNQWMKDVAQETPESPWARTVREEEQSQGQFAVDVSNTAGKIQDLHNQWGVDVSDEKAEQLANQVVMNKMSIEDVEGQLKDQANALYPHKPPEMATRDFAQPYMQTYMRTLETPEPDLDDRSIQDALSQGMNLAEFKEQLRQDDRWLETEGARTEMNTKISQLGRTMGFS